MQQLNKKTTSEIYIFYFPNTKFTYKCIKRCVIMTTLSNIKGKKHEKSNT